MYYWLIILIKFLRLNEDRYVIGKIDVVDEILIELLIMEMINNKVF